MTRVQVPEDSFVQAWSVIGIFARDMKGKNMSRGKEGPNFPATVDM